MSADDGPFCPECNEPVSATASYCLHCYADLPWAEDGDAADSATGTGDDTGWDSSADSTSASTDWTGDATTDTGSGERGLLHPEGTFDNVLTVVVAVVGSVVIGLVATFELLFITSSLWALPLGLVAWLAGLAYLARQYSVQETAGKTFYGIAVVLIAMPLMALSPAMDGTLADRASAFVVILVTMMFPAIISAGIGFVVMQFAPEAE